MQLQGAIFDLPGTLLDGNGVPLPGVEPFLSLMKMSDVWMYGVTDCPASSARQTLEGARLASFFRGILAAPEYGLPHVDAQLCEKALRRLRTHPRATLVFTSRAEALEELTQAGFQVVLVGVQPTEGQRALAAEMITDYRDMTRLLSD